MAMIKTLTRQGNSAALIIDRSMMQLMGIDSDTPLKLTLNGRTLTVEPLSVTERSDRFNEALKKTGRRHASAFKRLAQ